MLRALVDASKLPALEERLPKNPLVVDFDSEDKEIGVQAFMNRETAVWKHR